MNQREKRKLGITKIIKTKITKIKIKRSHRFQIMIWYRVLIFNVRLIK